MKPTLFKLLEKKCTRLEDKNLILEARILLLVQENQRLIEARDCLAQSLLDISKNVDVQKENLVDFAVTRRSFGN